MDVWIFLVIMGLLIVGVAAYLAKAYSGDQKTTKTKRTNTTEKTILALIAIGVFFSLIIIPTTVNPRTQQNALVFAVLLAIGGLLFYGHFSNAKDISERRVSKYEVTKATVLKSYGLDGRGFGMWWMGLLGFIVMFTGSLILSSVLASANILASIVPVLDLTGLAITTGKTLDVLMVMLNSASEDFFRAGIIVGFELLLAKNALRADPSIPSIDHALGKAPGQLFKFRKADAPMALVMAGVAVFMGLFFGTWHLGATENIAQILVISYNGIILYYIQRAGGIVPTIVAHFTFNMVVKSMLFIALGITLI